jgi:hypothetical protein
MELNGMHFLATAVLYPLHSDQVIEISGRKRTCLAITLAGITTSTVDVRHVAIADQLRTKRETSRLTEVRNLCASPLITPTIHSSCNHKALLTHDPMTPRKSHVDRLTHAPGEFPIAIHMASITRRTERARSIL